MEHSLKQHSRQRTLAPIVLVHGAWLGGWVWRDVVLRLRAAGHPVFAPTLTGLGERAHLGSAAVDLDTHIEDIVNVLVYEDLHEVRLVGHSYAGMVISGVAERVPERIGRLIYLDAFVPRDGERMNDLVPPEDAARSRELAHTRGDGWRVPLEGELGADAPEQRQWLQERITPQPLGVSEQPVRLTNPLAAALARTYVLCTTKPVRDLFAVYAERAAADRAWQLRMFAGDHMAMVSMPEALAALLLEVV